MDENFKKCNFCLYTSLLIFFISAILLIFTIVHLIRKYKKRDKHIPETYVLPKKDYEKNDKSLKNLLNDLENNLSILKELYQNQQHEKESRNITADVDKGIYAVVD